MTVTLTEIAALLTAIPALVTAIATAYVQVQARAEVAEVKATAARDAGRADVAEAQLAQAVATTSAQVEAVAVAAVEAGVSEAVSARANTAILVVSRDGTAAVARLLQARGWPAVASVSPDDRAAVEAAAGAADLIVVEGLQEPEVLPLLNLGESFVVLTPQNTRFTSPAFDGRVTLANMIATVPGHVAARAEATEAERRIMRLYRQPARAEGAEDAPAPMAATPDALAAAKAAAQRTLQADVEGRIAALVSDARVRGVVQGAAPTSWAAVRPSATTDIVLGG